MAANAPQRPAPDLFALLSTVLILAGLAFAGARLFSVSSQQDAILEQLELINATLQVRPPGNPSAAAPAARPAPPPPPENVSLDVSDSPTKGKADAKLTLVEFSDFECPFCARYVRDTYDRLQQDYVDTGKVRYVYRHFPLESIHPRALKAGVAGECAHRQGKFWEMHDRLFADQQGLADEGLLKKASASGLEMGAFQRCLGGEADSKVARDRQAGMDAGVTGTPYFLIGTTGPGGQVKVLRRLSGAQPYEAFQKILDELLAEPAAS